MEAPIHVSVLLAEAVAGLAPKSGGLYVDATCGLGGHSAAILEASAPDGRLLAVDRDPEALARARMRLAPYGDRATLVEARFSELPRIVGEVFHGQVDGILADLGVSSLQLDDPERGFSFRAGGPLDMRMGPNAEETAAALIAGCDAERLAEILRSYGEVDHAGKVARRILEARDKGLLVDTAALAEVVTRAVGWKGARSVHPATRVFQALRIAVNREIEELEALLAALPDLLRPGGRAAIISFHSLEDRLVKRAFRDPEPPRQPQLPRGLPVEVPRVEGPLRAISRKPIGPADAELQSNPRARSAKLRVAERRPTERLEKEDE